VRSNPKFTIHTNTEVVGFRRAPTGKLASVVARDRATGAETRLRPAAAFELIGLDPNTAFLRDALELDPRGFSPARTTATSMAGVLAAGDVRAGSTMQLASATGEGTSALLAVRGYLARSEVKLAAAG
jgi:thioredoxin reductase (NADPH)